MTFKLTDLIKSDVSATYSSAFHELFKDHTFVGTPGHEFIDASGGYGRDTVYTGGGKHDIYTNEGTTTIYGGTPQNVVSNHGGSHHVQSGESNIIDTAATLWDMTSGNNTIRVGDGNHVVHAGSGNESIVVGGTGNHTIYAGSGNDSISIVGPGQNDLWSGTGHTTYSFDPVSASGPGDSVIHNFSLTNDIFSVNQIYNNDADFLSHVHTLDSNSHQTGVSFDLGGGHHVDLLGITKDEFAHDMSHIHYAGH